MVLQTLTSTATRGVKHVAKTASSRRHMGSGPKPEWTGIDKKVRDIFPEDHQLAGAILGGYGALIGVAVLRSKLKGSAPEPEPAVKPAAVAASGGSDVLPSVESPAFESFLESDAFGKFLESEDSMMKWVDGLTQE
mmetsp:Transcript_58712/g.70035  ORF Transcript_58712/g.70035 Transcript_58712/m.70035 type:complete len:136 (-) Transcript_58712:93-500(-)|eukprot:CAMPEP_0172512424 /NCGR_PEP_ID=MMETSP1066-20121228/244599_1 /TAXON_ID=671091 /ORGANISM="Coscinodiscus wailesii, Strain CCMP2513" /LENGTH=135 /DNA_ID=CAMNT_0013292241 /DNA_START=305 /DNA_END=712 /DNA_ORIENTATION=+